MFDWFFEAFLVWLANASAAALQVLWDGLSATLLTSPDVTALPQVATISSRSQVVANTSYVLVVLAAGVLVMTRDTVQTRHGITDLAPRLVIGLVAANLATPLCRGMIDVANALTGALTDAPVAGPSAGRQMVATVTAAVQVPNTFSPAKLLLTIVVALIAVLSAMLLATAVVRIGILVVLTGIAPAALACHGLPQVDGVARLWWRSMIATLGTVTLQAFALHVGLSVFLAPGANLPALGLPGDVIPTINLFIVVCLLWATVKIPKLLARFATHAPARTPGAFLVRAVVAGQLARVLRFG